MKKFTLPLALTAFMSAVALIFSGCSDDPKENPAEAPVISAKGIEVPATAGTGKLAYSVANPIEGQTITVDLQDGITWIHDIATTSEQITFQVDANTGDARTATLTLKYQNADALKVEVRQMSADASISLNPKTISFAYTGGKESVTVTSSSDWTLTVPSGSESWVVPSATSGKSGDVVEFNAATSNETEDAKSADFVFTCKTQPVTLTVTQNAKGQLIFVTESPKEAAAAGETIAVKLKTNIEPVTVTIPEDVDWITNVTTRAMMEKEFQIKVEANSTDSDREATITFANEDAKEQFVIKQESTNPNLAKKIVDPLFRAYIMDNYDDGDGFLTPEEAATVTSINLDGSAGDNGDTALRPIASLAGIEIFTELTALKLNWIAPAIETVDLSKNTKLTSIDMMLGSGVKGIECANLPELTYFRMQRLSDEDAKQGNNGEPFEDSGLETINLDGCPKLGELVVRQLPNLRTLTFADSKDLSSLNLLGAFINKKELPVDEVTKVDISVCPNLSKLFGSTTLGMLVLTQAQYDQFYEDLVINQGSFFGIWSITDAPDVSEKLTDPVLRAACIAAFDLDKNGKLSQVEVNKASGDDGAGDLVIDKDTPNVADLKSFEGIEMFTYLRRIYVTGATALEDIDLSKNTWLRVISLSLTNGLNSLKFPVSAAYAKPLEVSLAFSDAAANVGPATLDFTPCAKKVSSIFIKNAPKLTSMNLTGCEQLAKLNIKDGMDGLTTLDISGAPLLVNPADVLFGSAMKEVTCTAAQKAALAAAYPNIKWMAGVEGAITDAALKAAVIAAFDKDKDGSLSQEEADAVETLSSFSLTGADNATSLKGIEIFKNLTSLTMSTKGSLDDIDLTQNTKLKTVTLSPKTGFTSIKCTNLPALTSFKVNFNSDYATVMVGPTALDLSGCTELATLDVEYMRKVSSITVTGCSKIATYKANAGMSALKQVDITPCPLLTSMWSYMGGGFMVADYMEVICTQKQKDDMKSDFSDADMSLTWTVK